MNQFHKQAVCRCPRTLVSGWIVCALLAGSNRLPARDIPVPDVADPDLQLSLLACEPQIVTPTGLAADREGRLFVVESHTHARGRDYEGPDSDRIVVFEDTDDDGIPDRSRICADGLRHALAIAFSSDRRLFVVQMKSVLVLQDTDDDGTYESRNPVLTIETDNNNNHGVLLGIACDDRDRMHVSLGNIGGSAYVIRGSDGRRVAGQGDTGLIVRCHADGSSLERFAHGFWNPPELTFDTAGRLLATDNDPDSRGPNRVLHVIPGGDYGYRSRFGGSGLHPYCAWNGELPGTLPMLAGVGEAPVGLLDCAATSLPQQYAGDLLVGVWGTNEVVRVRTTRRGTSLAGTVEPLITGDAAFRPTSITATADGAVYIADWADRRYPVHGRGRIWRLSARPGVTTLNPQPPFSSADTDPGQAELTRLQDTASFEQLVAAATGRDPVAAGTALIALGRPRFRERVIAALDGERADVRLAALLALRKAGAMLDAERLRRLLADADADVRRLAMIWIGETTRPDLAADLRRSLSLQTASAEQFETFLATVRLLTDEANSPTGRVDQKLLLTVLADERQPAAARVMAVRYLSDVVEPGVRSLLSRLARSGERSLAAESIRKLGDARAPEVGDLLVAIATDPAAESSRRCDAIMSCLASDSRRPDSLLPLIADNDPQVSLTAARGLTRFAQQESVRDAFQSALPSVAGPVAEQLRFGLQQSADERPDNDDRWMTQLAAGGDPEAGRRVFFDSRVMCARCHRIEGRGGRIGPDLTNISATKSRRRILSSILNPSQDRSPDYQGYVVAMDDGRIRKGTQFHFRGESAELLLEDGTRFRFRLSEAVEYRPLDESLMPERLEETMSVSELRDLLAWLETLCPQGAEPTTE